MNRLPDSDLEVLVDAAAEGTWNSKAAHAGGPQFSELERGRRNEIREAALPFIFHGTKALAELGYVKPRTITAIEEVDALPDMSIVMTHFGDAWTIYRDNPLIPAECFHGLVAHGPATVLHEPEVTA